jgi:hypothetical protein
MAREEAKVAQQATSTSEERYIYTCPTSDGYRVRDTQSQIILEELRAHSVKK